MNFGMNLMKARAGTALALIFIIPPTLLAACGSSGGSDAGGATGNVVIKDENNYTATSSLTIPRVETAPGADLDICWPGITSDLLCHDVVPTTDINNVSFLQVLNFSEDQIATALGTGQSFTKYVVYRDHHVDAGAASTCTKLSAMTLGQAAVDPALDYLPAAGKAYMLLFANGIVAGTGSRSMVFLEPTATSTNTTVTAPEGCGILDFKPDLVNRAPVSVPAAGPWKADWSQLAHDGLSNPVVYSSIDSLMVGYYEGLTVADLQARFFDIDRIATSLYKMPILDGAKTADLSQAATLAGEAFPGFGRTAGVWALGLLCSSCQVPAPIAVAILAPAAN